VRCRTAYDDLRSVSVDVSACQTKVQTKQSLNSPDCRLAAVQTVKKQWLSRQSGSRESSYLHIDHCPSWVAWAKCWP